MIPRYCPQCQADLRGEPIPPESRHLYGGDDGYFYRVIAVYDIDKDRSVAWQCPDCGHEWNIE